MNTKMTYEVVENAETFERMLARVREAQKVFATYTQEQVTIDGNIITGKGPGASFAYAYRLLEEFKGASIVAELKKGMMYEF